MKNVTKILTAVVLCAALFASTQRTDALGGNPALWPGDEANIAAFPAQVNNHSYLQVNGLGTYDVDGVSTTDAGSVSLVTQKDGTTWGFNYGGDYADDWMSMHWGNGDIGVMVGLQSTTGATTAEDHSDMSVSYGQVFGFGELGAHLTVLGADDADPMLGVNLRRATSAFLFDNMVVSIDDLMADDLAFDVDLFTHMDAGGADVVFGWGMEYDAAGVGTNMATMTQTATIGVEANMTDWATLRLGYNWSHELACDNDTDACGENNGDGEDGYALGLGFNWGGLTADYLISSSLLQDPIGTITGYSAGALTDHGITLTYSF
tara:strand:- start:9614 stop:10573 length:960 start_codon:yes stop_codon:yes gene_type:complete